MIKEISLKYKYTLIPLQLTNIDLKFDVRGQCFWSGVYKNKKINIRNLNIKF